MGHTITGFWGDTGSEVTEDVEVPSLSCRAAAEADLAACSVLKHHQGTPLPCAARVMAGVTAPRAGPHIDQPWTWPGLVGSLTLIEVRAGLLTYPPTQEVKARRGI